MSAYSSPTCSQSTSCASRRGSSPTAMPSRRHPPAWGRRPISCAPSCADQNGVQDVIAGEPRIALQVAHRLQRGVVRVVAGPAHTVREDPYDVVALVGVDERVVDADVGQHADEHEGTDAHAAQDDVEIGAVEDRVAALLDQVLVGPWDQLGDDLRAWCAEDAMDTFA